MENSIIDLVMVRISTKSEMTDGISPFVFWRRFPSWIRKVGMGLRD